MPLHSISIKFLILTIACALPEYSHAARILGFFPTPSKSHLLIHCAISETLAKAGHDVTVISSTPNVYKNSTYKYIDLEVPGYDLTFMKDMINQPLPFYKQMTTMLDFLSKSANESITNPKMQQFLRDHGEGSFDLLILGYFMNDFHLGLGAHFRCPIIISFMIQPIQAVNKFIGNPTEISYVPTVFSTLKQPMDFFERVKNLLSTFFGTYFIGGVLDHHTTSLYEYHFPASKYPPLKEVAKNVSLIFCNHHSLSQGPIRPNVPALIEIGGIQIKEKNTLLPEEIAKFLNDAKSGAIYFSLGSNIDGSVILEPVAKAMFNALSKLPYKVLWKWSGSDIPGTSNNIMFKNWLPQDDILAHPNIKLFITHGGKGSVVESQYHGVPMIAIPLFAEQPANAAALEHSGFGVQLDYVTLTEEKFSQAILEVLQNPKYSKAVKEFSKIYRDRPMTPRQLVTFWTEYVLRHKGAKHLQSPALELNSFQLLSLDVIAFLAVIQLIVIFVLLKGCKLLCCRKKEKSQYPAIQKKKIN